MKQIFLTLSILALLFLEALSLHKEYYDILGVAPSASQNEIKKAYRTLSTQYHPDRNPGNTEANEKFVKIASAYEVLSNPEKRRKYDQLGPDFEKQQQQPGHPFGDFFGDFFGGGHHHQERRGPELAIKIPVRLEDLYKGREIGVFHTKQIICPHCRATGADDPDHINTCPMCGGQGFVLRRQQIGPGFFQQFQTQCDRCGGKGKIFTSTCHVCKGDKVLPGMDKFSLYIERGAKHGHRITFPGQGNEFSDIGASDIVFVVIETPHPVFRRENDNLRAIVELSLKEALLGFEKHLVHLDGHWVPLKRDHVTQPGDIDTIKGEGMPQHGFSSYKGDLFVEYKVRFPEKISPEQAKLWEQFFVNR